jgi:hypothetical protein
MCICINVYSQKDYENTILRYNNKDKIIIDFTNTNSDLLLKKQLNYNPINENIYELEKQFKNIDLNMFSNNLKLGKVEFIDTVNIPLNLKFDESNFAIRNFINRSYTKSIKESKFGIYFITIILRHSLYSDALYTIQLSVRPGQILIKTNFNYYPLTSGFFTTKQVAYNDQLYVYRKYDDDDNTLNEFNPTKAYKQLYFLASIIESKSRIHNLIEDCIKDVGRINNK